MKGLGLGKAMELFDFVEAGGLLEAITQVVVRYAFHFGHHSGGIPELCADEGADDTRCYWWICFLRHVGSADVHDESVAVPAARLCCFRVSSFC